MKLQYQIQMFSAQKRAMGCFPDACWSARSNTPSFRSIAEAKRFGKKAISSESKWRVAVPAK